MPNILFKMIGVRAAHTVRSSLFRMGPVAAIGPKVSSFQADKTALTASVGMFGLPNTGPHTPMKCEISSVSCRFKSSFSVDKKAALRVVADLIEQGKTSEADIVLKKIVEASPEDRELYSKLWNFWLDNGILNDQDVNHFAELLGDNLDGLPVLEQSESSGSDSEVIDEAVDHQNKCG